MQRTSRMLLRLEIETRAQHPAADHPWLELMSRDASRGHYLDHLITTYGFEAPVEAALALTPYISDVIHLRPRARSGFIVEDLLALGLTPSQIARLPQCHVAPFREPAEALGWLYVLERATLLHDTVRSYMMLRLPSVGAWSYLSAYRDVVDARWQELGHALDAYAVTLACGDAIVAAAHAAFACQQDWRESDPARFAQALASETSTRYVRSRAAQRARTRS